MGLHYSQVMVQTTLHGSSRLKGEKKQIQYKMGQEEKKNMVLAVEQDRSSLKVEGGRGNADSGLQRMEENIS